MNPDFTITTDTDVSPTMIRLRGELDLDAAHQLRAVLRKIRGDAIVDCSNLSFIDSTGMSVLLATHRRVEAEGHTFTLAGVSTRMRHTLHLAGLDTVLTLEPTLILHRRDNRR